MLIKKQNGFSLLEVLIGATIFTYGALGIAALQISSIKGNSFSGNLSEATTLATNKFEELLTATYDETKDYDDQGNLLARLEDDDNNGVAGLSDCANTPSGQSTGACTDADGKSTGQGKNGNYTVYYNVAAGYPAANSKTINVIVKWSVKGVPRVIQLTSVRSDLP